MKKKLLLSSFLLAGFVSQAQFTAGNLIVSKISASGTQTDVLNSDTNNAYIGSIQQMTTAGVNVGTAIAIPDIVFDARLIAYEASLSLSSDKKYVTMVGFVGAPNVGATTFRAYPRRIYSFNSNGEIQAAATSNINAADFNANGYRGAIVSADNTSNYLFALSGSIPLRTIPVRANNPSGTTTSSVTTGAAQSSRSINYTGGLNNVLYGVNGTNIVKYNTADYTYTSVATGTDYTQVVLLDLQTGVGDAEGNDVMYAAHRTSGVTKFTWSGTAWVAGTSINGETIDGLSANLSDTEPGYGVYAITGRVEGGKAAIYALSINGSLTTGTYKTSHLFKIVDNSAYNADWTAPTTVRTLLKSTTATGVAGEVFRSVSFVPEGTGTLSNNSFEKQTLGWYVSPNPSKGVINLTTTNAGTFTIYNILGQKALEFNVEAGVSNDINVENLIDGTYFVKGANGTQKLIIQK